jgi:hypothetical protein
MSDDIREILARYKAIRAWFESPPNAVPDSGINLKKRRQDSPPSPPPSPAKPVQETERPKKAPPDPNKYMRIAPAGRQYFPKRSATYLRYQIQYSRVATTEYGALTYVLIADVKRLAAETAEND